MSVVSAPIKIGFVQPNFSVGPEIYNGIYLPYTVGVLISYLKSQSIDFSITNIIFKRDPIIDSVKKLYSSDIIAFSTYVWNKNYNFALAKEIKRLYPNTLIVFGGPEVPHTKLDIFKNHPYIDLIIVQEGELSFASIVKQFSNRNFKDIPGIIINKNRIPIKKLPAQRLNDLEQLPSPYLTDVFDQIMQDHPEIQWHAILETNRGCPYQCTFCDWGSLTYSKIKKFNLSKVFDEIEWMGKKHIEYMYIADANFGIFPDRDDKIIEKLIATNNQYGYPKGIAITWAKNQKSAVVNIAKKLVTNGIDHGLLISFQSLSSHTLDVIKRTNLEINKAEEILKLCKDNSVPVLTELICGLPGETLDTWKQNFYKLFRLGQSKGITIYHCQLLENTELNLDQSEEYEIKTVYSTEAFNNSKADIESGIAESIKIVSSTKDLPLDRMCDTYSWSWLFNTFHIYGGLTNYISDYCEREKILSYEEFYEKLFIELSNSILHEEMEIHRSHVKHWLTTGEVAKENIFGFMVTGYKLQLLGTVFKIHLDKTLKHRVQLIIRDFIRNIIKDLELANDLIEFQENHIVDFDNIEKYPLIKTFRFDWLNYFNKNVKLKKTETNLMFNHKAKSSDLVGPLDKVRLLLVELIFYRRRISFGTTSVSELI
jgi:radical SAM superfamily enzyme YgiQ (UPF0313 family)